MVCSQAHWCDFSAHSIYVDSLPAYDGATLFLLKKYIYYFVHDRHKYFDESDVQS